MTTIVCPNCHREGSSGTQVPMGTKVRCPACGEAFRFEPAPQATPDPRVPGGPPASPPPQDGIRPAGMAPRRRYPAWVAALIPMVPIAI